MTHDEHIIPYCIKWLKWSSQFSFILKNFLLPKVCFFATLGVHLGFSAKLRIWQVSACKMEPQNGFMILAWTTPHPPTAKIFLSMLCGVPTPTVPLINKECAVSLLPVYVFSVRCPSLLCHTLLCLGFKAKLRIWQVPACKMSPKVSFFGCYLTPVESSI